MSGGEIRSILLAAGGTGGHIWPAISFGAWIAANRPGVRVAYLSGTRGLEREIYAAAGVTPREIELEGSPIGAPKGRKWKRWRDLLRGFGRARRLVGELTPDLCILFGGYLSVPALFACLAGRVPVLAHEQNARAGRVTRLARALKVPVMTGWSRCDPLREGGFTHTGVPIRALGRDGRGAPQSAEEAWRALGLAGEKPEGPVVVVMTGSLGSRSLEERVAELAARPGFRSWRFLSVTPEVRAPAEAGERLTLLPKRWDAAPLFAVADILVVRGGASTLTEALAAGIPTVVVPWRGAADDHQMENALALSETGGACVWDERAENIDDFEGRIQNLQRGPKRERGVPDKKMYNAAGMICEKVWETALRAYERRGSD